MRLLHNADGDPYLACEDCPLKYGEGWYAIQKDLIGAWETAPSRKKTLGKTKPKAVVKIDQNGNILARYKSLSEAAKKNPMSKTSIENRTMRKLKHEFAVCDFTFRLADDIK